MQHQQQYKWWDTPWNKTCRTPRGSEKRRRRAIVRAIRLRETWLIAKCSGSPSVGWLCPGWGADSAAAETEAQLKLKPTSLRGYYSMVERRASFLALFNGQPTRRDALVWESEVYGPMLP